MAFEKVLRESLELNIKYRTAISESGFNLDIFKGIMETEYRCLYAEHPAIFNIATGKSYNFERLSKMLKLAEKVKTNEVSEHDASVAVGQLLVDDIVKPQLKNNP
tara:strand:- start:1054 stop:1368 length:315 start_codon:yes stop_codon:yes gene_type:complete